MRRAIAWTACLLLLAAAAFSFVISVIGVDLAPIYRLGLLMLGAALLFFAAGLSPDPDGLQ